MEWSSLLTTRRTGQSIENVRHDRTEFQRDFDRMVFSPPFRRLQNKTQVFPLPGSVFVHNRLTHSLEVASVGRSLGNNIARRLADAGEAGPFAEEIGSIVAAACLAHDMGNPPFGHSGERAISDFFTRGGGSRLLQSADMTETQREDLRNFDGNANTFRLLSHTFNGRREGGFALTYPTVASIIKYPAPSPGRKKFGYFDQDKAIFTDIMQTLGVEPRSAEGCYSRYPLVYLVEAADDICYQVMDVEDACRLGILGYDETYSLYTSFFDPVADKRVFENIDRVRRQVTDEHEQIAYLRSITIGRLVTLCTDIFWNNRHEILAGQFEKGLIDRLPKHENDAMERVKTTAIHKIYSHQTVKEIELSGVNILGTLLDCFADALDKPKFYYSKLILSFIPEQYRVPEDAPMYEKLLAAVDTVSGMTDIYALDMFKKIKGIGLN